MPSADAVSVLAEPWPSFSPPAAPPAAGRRLPWLPARRGDDPDGRAAVVSRVVRVRRADDRFQGRRGARPGDRHRREAPVPGRRTGQGRPAAVRDRSQAVRAQVAAAECRPCARAGAESTGRSRSRAAEAARRAQGDRPEGSRRRRVERRSRRRGGQVGAGEARRAPAQPRLHPRRGADLRLDEPRASIRRRARDANQTLLTTISQIDPIWVAFNISENEQPALEPAPSPSGGSACPRTTRTT